MASSAQKAARAVVPSTDRQSFAEYLKKSRRIVALVGAGLSAASGLPTFRGAGGLWRTHDATDLATPEAFEENPDLVWQFYSFRRHMALKAAPNKAHHALAELSRKNKDFITLSQNVDGKAWSFISIWFCFIHFIAFFTWAFKNSGLTELSHGDARSVATSTTSLRPPIFAPRFPFQHQMHFILLQLYPRRLH